MGGQSLAMMPWFPRDFVAATRGWSLVERGVYRELLDAQWEFGSLPNNQKELARIVGITAREFTAAWRRVSVKFVAAESGGLINLRLEEHRAKALRIREVRGAAGSRGGQASVQAKRQASVQANASASGSQFAEAKFNYPSPSPSPSPSPTPSLCSGEGPGEGGLAAGAARPAAPPRNRSKNRKLARRIPDDFELTPELRAFAKREGLDAERVFANFCDYWRAASGAKARKHDWAAAWRQWCRKEADTPRPVPRGTPRDWRDEGGAVRTPTAEQRATSERIALERSARSHGIDPTGLSESQINNLIWQHQQAARGAA